MRYWKSSIMMMSRCVFCRQATTISEEDATTILPGVSLECRFHPAALNGSGFGLICTNRVSAGLRLRRLALLPVPDSPKMKVATLMLLLLFVEFLLLLP